MEKLKVIKRLNNLIEIEPDVHHTAWKFVIGI